MGVRVSNRVIIQNNIKPREYNTVITTITYKICFSRVSQHNAAKRIIAIHILYDIGSAKDHTDA